MSKKLGKLLDDLIRNGVIEARLIESLVMADTTDNKMCICEEAAETPEFHALMEAYGEAATQQQEGKAMLSVDDFSCTKENVVGLVTVCIIEGIDIEDLFCDEGYDLVIKALEEAKAEGNEQAEKMYSALVEDYKMVSDLELEEAMSIF